MTPLCAGFDGAPHLTGGGFTLTPLLEGDRAELASAASDPLIWEQHPAPDRHKPEVFATYFDFLLENGGTLVIRDAGGRVVGCSRYYSSPDRPDDVSIGFTFLTRDHWGGPANLAVKTLMVEHVFAERDVVWLHIGADNIRSQKATAKLGAVHATEGVLDLAGSGAVPWQHWRLDRAAWRKRAS